MKPRLFNPFSTHILFGFISCAVTTPISQNQSVSLSSFPLSHFPVLKTFWTFWRQKTQHVLRPRGAILLYQNKFFVREEHLESPDFQRDVSTTDFNRSERDILLHQNKFSQKISDFDVVIYVREKAQIDVNTTESQSVFKSRFWKHLPKSKWPAQRKTWKSKLL